MKDYFYSEILPRIETVALLVAIGGIILKLANLPYSSIFLIAGMGTLSLVSVAEFGRKNFATLPMMKFLVRAMPLVRAICQVAILLTMIEHPQGANLIVQGSIAGFVVLLLYYIQPDKSWVHPREFEKTLVAVGLALFIFLGLK